MGLNWYVLRVQSGREDRVCENLKKRVLAAGDSVHVYAPEDARIGQDNEGVTIHRLPGHFGVRALVGLSRSRYDKTGAAHSFASGKYDNC